MKATKLYRCHITILEKQCSDTFMLMFCEYQISGCRSLLALGSCVIGILSSRLIKPLRQLARPDLDQRILSLGEGLSLSERLSTWSTHLSSGTAYWQTIPYAFLHSSCVFAQGAPTSLSTELVFGKMRTTFSHRQISPMKRSSRPKGAAADICQAMPERWSCISDCLQAQAVSRSRLSLGKLSLGDPAGTARRNRPHFFDRGAIVRF